MADDAARPAAPSHDPAFAALQRRAAFEAEFGSGRGVAVAVRNCLIEASTKLHVIVGGEAAEAAFEVLVARAFRAEVPQGMWRETLHANENAICSQTMVGRAFRELAAYARYGISLNGGVNDSDRVDLLNAAHQRALELEVLTHWSFKGTELEKILLQADARVDLDHGEPVDPRSLAALGEVDEQIIRDQIANGDLPCACGRVPATAALRWLSAEGRVFRDSRWRAQELFRDLPGREALAA